MTLAVFTARIASRDVDRLDITRKSAPPEGIAFAPSAQLLASGKAGRVSFLEYGGLYRAEMRTSYRTRRAAWDALLARPRVVLCCYCVDPGECHRELFAKILCKLGAHLFGEIGLNAALATVRATIAAGDTLSMRAIVDAADAAGCEVCTLLAVLERTEVVARGTYARAQEAGLSKLAKQAREARAVLP